MKIKILTDTEQFKKYRSSWIGLESYCDLFSLYDWLYTWWENYGEGKELRIYVAEDEDKGALSILPLMLVGSKDGPDLTQLGASGSDYFGIISMTDSLESVTEIFESIISREEYERFYITNLRSGDTHTELLIRSAFSVFNDIEIIKQGKTYFVDTSTTYEDYYRTRSKNFRHKLNQIAKHADNYDFRVITDYHHEIIDELMDLHKSRWMEKMQLSVFYDQRRWDFTHHICRKSADAGRLRIFVLMNENRIRAYRLGFVHKGIYYDWNTAFDSCCKEDSVGIQLCDRVIRYCCENDIQEFDFLRGEEEYKRRFATGEREYIAIDIKRNLEIEGYIYQPAVKGIMDRLQKISFVIFELKNRSFYDEEIKDDLK